MFDIKRNPILSPDGYYTGKLLGNKYISARSAGNYLYGKNIRSGRFGQSGVGMTLAQGLRLAGLKSKGELNIFNGISAILGHSKYPPPNYGDDWYSVRMIIAGYHGLYDK